MVGQYISKQEDLPKVSKYLAVVLFFFFLKSSKKTTPSMFFFFFYKRYALSLASQAYSRHLAQHDSRVLLPFQLSPRLDFENAKPHRRPDKTWGDQNLGIKKLLGLFQSNGLNPSLMGYQSIGYNTHWNTIGYKFQYQSNRNTIGYKKIQV